MRKSVKGIRGERTSVIFYAISVSVIVIVSTLIGAMSDLFLDRASLAVTEGEGNPTVIIDAGHGGEDCGAIGKNGVYEKDLNLQIAVEIGNMLAEKGYDVVYTRTDDALLYLPEENIKGIRKISDLKNRCKIASEYKNAIFISIHMNSFGDSKYSGLQVYYSENDSAARTLAESIQRSVTDALQPSNKRVIKRGEGIYVLENIYIPAVLVECGFLSNVEECEKLSEKEYQKQLSFRIVCGIIEYIESQK